MPVIHDACSEARKKKDRFGDVARLADQSVLNSLKTLTNHAQDDFKVEGT
ncbi:hypothetical protein [Agrobacterium tumefaciens]|nr:hypothetical protein [Agrobacterium tumefaciens]